MCLEIISEKNLAKISGGNLDLLNDQQRENLWNMAGSHLTNPDVVVVDIGDEATPPTIINRRYAQNTIDLDGYFFGSVADAESFRTIFDDYTGCYLMID